MMILDGKKIAQDLRDNLKDEVAIITEKNNLKPGLAVIIVGENQASKIYVNSKIKACAEVGINSFHIELPENVTEEELLNQVEKLNNDKTVHGILVQLPLPKGLDESKVINKITPTKDVDCFTQVNLGKMFLNEEDAIGSCTPAGIMEILKVSKVELAGKNVVIIGRSNIVGKPLAVMMINAGATVTVCNSKTKNLEDFTKEADVLVVAIGKDRFIKSNMIKKDAIIIDVGINRVDGKIYGDVDFEDVKEKVAMITPVPGGVGPMTIAMLLKNCVKLYKQKI